MIVSFTLFFLGASVPIVIADTPRQLWAVVVGIDGGAATHLDNDAQDFVNVLMSKHGYPRENIILLRNEEATREAVLNALEWLGTQELSPDGVSIFFSCHGSPNNLILFDTVLWDSELSTILSSFDSHNILIIINSCNSGTFLDVADAFETGILITACTAEEQTYDIPRFENTIFTQYFLEALSELASVQDSFKYAYYHCAVETPGTLTPTHPQMVDKYGETYILNSPGHTPLFSTQMPVMTVPVFSNLIPVVTIMVFSYTLYKKKRNISTESVPIE